MAIQSAVEVSGDARRENYSSAHIVYIIEPISVQCPLMGKKRLAAPLLALLLFLSALSPAYSQYKTSDDLDVPLISAALGMGGLAYLLRNNVEPLTPEEVKGLLIEDELSCDRWVGRRLSPASKTISDVMLSVCTVSPILVLASPELDHQQRQSYAIMYAETMAINFSLTWLTKHLVKRIRPYAYNPAVPLDKKIRSADARKSFYSGHSSASFASMVFLARTYAAFFPKSNLKPLVWAFGLTAAGIVAVNRMLSGSHFLTDVLVGAVVGSLIGYLIPEIHKSGPNNGTTPANSFKLSFQFSF